LCMLYFVLWGDRGWDVLVRFFILCCQRRNLLCLATRRIVRNAHCIAVLHALAYVRNSARYMRLDRVSKTCFIVSVWPLHTFVGTHQ
jgi:hypothetical protein